MVGIGLGLNRSGKVVSIPGKLFGAVRVGNILKGGLTNSLKGSVSAGAVLAGALSLHVALAGTIPSNAALSGALTAGASAALDLPFSTMSSGSDLTTKGVTFTRSGLATQYDSTGKLTYAPNNLLTYSGDLTNSAWDVYGPSVSRTTNTITFSGSGNDFLFQSQAGSDPTQNFIFSAMISSPTLTSITIGSAGATTPVSVTSTPTRVSVVLVHNYAVIPGFDNRAASGGSGVAGVLTVSNVQLEAVTYQTTPRPYVATTSAAYYGPRFDYDPVTLQPRGLLIEESRTNLATYSGDIANAAWDAGSATATANTATAPDGTAAAATVTLGPGTSFRRQGPSGLTSGGTYTFSAYVKAAPSGSATSFRLTSNNGLAWNTGGSTKVTLTSAWQRVTLTWTNSGNTTAFLILGALDASGADDATCYGDVLIWGAQLEAGSFATSYISTTSASVTRAAETASVPIPATVSTIRHTYSDDTTADISVTPSSTYTFPTTQKTYKLTQSVGA